MPNKDNVQIAPAESKLGVLIPGMGAVTTTFIAGLKRSSSGWETDWVADPVGDDSFRKGPKGVAAIKDFVPLAKCRYRSRLLGYFEDNAYEAAMKAGVLETRFSIR